MKLTSKGRYAVMALADLAKFNSINPVSLRDISLRQGISLDFLEQIFSKLKKYNIVKECYKKADHFINLASNSLSVFNDSEEKKILEKLTSFSLERNF